MLLFVLYFVENKMKILEFWGVLIPRKAYDCTRPNFIHLQELHHFDMNR